MVKANGADFVNVYVYAHTSVDWPADPADAFDLPMSLEAAYEETGAGGNLILAAVDVVCPNGSDTKYLYSQFQEYAANLQQIAGGPPFVWPRYPVALRLWVQPTLVPEWTSVMLKLLRHILLPGLDRAVG